MKIGVVTRSNDKGQIVIPKHIRQQLGIDATVPLNVFVRGDSICVYPISEFFSHTVGESSYIKILERTKGAWQEESWQESRLQRHNIELAASKARKQAW